MDIDSTREPVVREVVKFDLLGDRRLVYMEEAVTYHTNEMYLVPLPSAFLSVTIISDRPISYCDIRWVGLIRRRQWWALVLGAIGLALGLFWFTRPWQGWGPFGFELFVFLVLGALPLYFFIKGRAFLAIVSDSTAFCFPADRKKRQVRRAIVLLRQYCHGSEVK